MRRPGSGRRRSPRHRSRCPARTARRAACGSAARCWRDLPGPPVPGGPGPGPPRRPPPAGLPGSHGHGGLPRSGAGDDPAVEYFDAAPGAGGDGVVVGDDDDRGAGGLSSSSRARMDTPVAESRLPVGSSASTTGGWPAMARAIATRWRSPPDSWVGRAAALCPARPGPARRRPAAAAGRGRRRRKAGRRRRCPGRSGARRGRTAGTRTRSGRRAAPTAAGRPARRCPGR